MLQPPVPEARLHHVWSWQPLTKAESTLMLPLLENWEGLLIANNRAINHITLVEERLPSQIALNHTNKRAFEGSIHGECLQSSKVNLTRDTSVCLTYLLVSFHLGLIACIHFTEGLVSSSDCLS